MSDQSKVKIRFLRDYEVQDEHEGTAQATKYKAGGQPVMNPRSAAHFVRKGVAAYVAKG